MGLFKGAVDIPPIFIDQLAHVILRNVLDGADDPLRLRAAELFFREQKATIRDGHALLADLDVLDKANAALYWERESRHDTVISLTYGRPALDALCRAMEAWIWHFLNTRVVIKPVRKIEEPRWAWHVGLDAESTAILNELWAGGEIDAGRMRHVLALFALQFEDPAMMRPDIAGRTVYLGLSADDADIVRMKPQNLLTGLPLHEA